MLDPRMRPELVGKHIWFFDGTCALCDRGVRFLAAHDRGDVLRIAPLQSEFARRELTLRGVDQAELDAGAANGRAYRTFYLLADYGTSRERLLNRSRGAAYLLSRLGGGWGLLGRLALIVPAPLLDPLYRWVSRNRYRWFGEHDACALPTSAQRARLVPDS
jgi:predicted DCC family thiol-disulfide oxidoreductase YuxK